MRANEFLRQRVENLHAFFQLRFGSHWHHVVCRRIGQQFRTANIFPGIHKAEQFAIELGFRPLPPCWNDVPFERNFLARLEDVLGSIQTGIFLGDGPTLREVLEEFFQYRRHARPPASDILPSESPMIPGSDSRTWNPSTGNDSVLDRLKVMTGAPPPRHAESIGGQQPAGFRSVVGARTIESLVWDI